MIDGLNGREESLAEKQLLREKFVEAMVTEVADGDKNSVVRKFYTIGDMETLTQDSEVL